MNNRHRDKRKEPDAKAPVHRRGRSGLRPLQGPGAGNGGHRRAFFQRDAVCALAPAVPVRDGLHRDMKGDKAMSKNKQAVLYADLRKFNPYHDSRGRFTSRNAHTLFSPGNNPAQAKRSIDAENKRRAAEGMDQLVSGAYMTMGRVAYGSALKTYLDEQAKKKDPIQQTAAPYKAGKSVKWGNMSDDEFVRDLEKYMPGIHDIATKRFHDEFML